MRGPFFISDAAEVMIPWTLLDTADAPDGGAPLRLMQRGLEFSIMIGPVALMNSRRAGSEEALARLACRCVAERPRPIVLVGGLGMGFTLRAAREALPADASILVSELIPAVVAWARGPLAAMFADSFEDPRVSVAVEDVGRRIETAIGSLDAILLDVDNGPEGLTSRANDALYSLPGLAASLKALKPGGVFALWSAHADKAFARRLRAAGFEVEETTTRAHAGRGARHTIWIAAKPRATRSRARERR